jgi:HAD superfamily hydrolase (TIGR01509 family)
MDGVLIDSEPAWEKAVDRVFAGLGIVLDAALKAHTAGMGNEESVRLVLSRHPAVRADVAAICRTIDAAVLRVLAAGIGTMPGADSLLRRLAEQGVPLALVSTSGAKLIQTVVDANGWGELFRLTLSSEAVGPGKPDPAVYREAVRRMDADVERSVAVEDTVNGARSAHGTGLRVVGFTRNPVVSGAMRPWVWRVATDFVEVGRLLTMLELDKRCCH